MSIQNYKEEMEHYFITLSKLASNLLNTLQNVIKRRISDDVSYELSKNKKLPKEERIGAIIETAIKDGMVDLIRDYRYEFQKKMQTILEYMRTQYGEFQSDVAIVELDIRAFCEEHLNSVLIFKNNAIISASINDAIKRYAKEDLALCLSHIENLLRAEFTGIEEMLQPKLSKINYDLLNSFMQICEAPACLLKERFITQEELLEKAMRQMKDMGVNREERLAQIEEKERAMRKILDNLEALKGLK